jgi:EAL domain-containing protein (putative c-di-GMP-specific phosphodiesterase class I)
MEIRKDVAAYDLELVRAILSDVRRLGIRVTIDHFGTGGSSFAQLRRLPVGVVKTDASFVRDFNRGGEAMIATTLSMAAKLGLETIVDGVESHAMLERVRGIGATLVQGFLLAHAMPAAALADWCRRPVRESETLT